MDREPLVVRTVKLAYNCFVHRLLPDPKKQESALWRVCFYDIHDGTEMTVVTTETAAVSSVKRHIIQGNQQVYEDEGEVKRSWVHKQAKRVDLQGGGKAFSLIQINVYAGPHETVLVEIRAFPQQGVDTNKMVLRMTTEEIKARLSLLDVPTRDVVWWRSMRGKGEHTIWRPLVSLLQFKTIQIEEGKKRIASLGFNDEEMRAREGYDVYGMVAIAHALMQLAVVTSVQKRYGMAFTLSFPEVPEVVTAEEGAKWESRADFNMSLSLRVSRFCDNEGDGGGISVVFALSSLLWRNR